MGQGNESKFLTPALCRAARGLLDWTQQDLAERAGVSRSTIKDYENCRHDLHRATAAQLSLALEGEASSSFTLMMAELGYAPNDNDIDADRRLSSRRNLELLPKFLADLRGPVVLRGISVRLQNCESAYFIIAQRA